MLDGEAGPGIDVTYLDVMRGNTLTRGTPEVSKKTTYYTSLAGKFDGPSDGPREQFSPVWEEGWVKAALGDENLNLLRFGTRSVGGAQKCTTDPNTVEYSIVEKNGQTVWDRLPSPSIKFINTRITTLWALVGINASGAVLTNLDQHNLLGDPQATDCCNAPDTGTIDQLEDAAAAPEGDRRDVVPPVETAAAAAAGAAAAAAGADPTGSGRHPHHTRSRSRGGAQPVEEGRHDADQLEDATTHDGAE